MTRLDADTAPVGGGRHPVARPFYYANGVMHDLNALIPPGSGYELVSVGGINDRGQIVCTANRFVDGALRPRAVVLNPQ